jgi:c-di-GMP-binding flagellar brake protein YcgR
MTDQRRRSPRYPTDWAATFRFDPRAEWRNCRFIDVSSDGAALELYGVGDEEVLEGPIFVDVKSVTGSDDGISVSAVIRHRARTTIGRTIVGIEFHRLSVEDLQLLRLLVSLRAAV